jgi:hypothetical protein
MNHNTNGSTDVGLWQINSVRITLFRSTGDHATVERLPATLLRIYIVPSRYTKEVKTLGSLGALTAHAAADSR